MIGWGGLIAAGVAAANAALVAADRQVRELDEQFAQFEYARSAYDDAGARSALAGPATADAPRLRWGQGAPRCAPGRAGASGVRRLAVGRVQ